jgi:hypothetical protein
MVCSWRAGQANIVAQIRRHSQRGQPRTGPPVIEGVGVRSACAAADTEERAGAW